MIKRRRLFAFLFFLIIFSPPCHAAATPPAVSATLPWLAGMTRFIVGGTMKVQCLSSWNASGALKVARKISANTPAIALDGPDAAKFGAVKGQEGFHVLYDNLPINAPHRDALPFNPSILPFMSQRLLIVLCKMIPDNYPFYQRKVAEFQSRLESAVEVGRSLIGGENILDLSGAVSPWVRAAAPKTVRPPDELIDAWAENKRTEDLELAVKEANSRGWLVLADAWSPAPLKNAAAKAAKNILIAPPENNEYEFFVYLHDIYLQMQRVFAGEPATK
jgi:hypothetical protein